MRLVTAALVLELVGCASPQPVEPDVRRHGLTWKADVAPLMTAQCNGCHTGADPAAGYRTDSYLAAITRAHAGDEASRLLAVAHDATHAAFTTTFATLRTWVVDDRLGYEDSAVHGPGVMNPADPEFHGAVARDIGWKLDTCAGCHGGDFAGGKVGVSCLPCHTGGPTACTTCHGQPPPTGAHVAHVGHPFDCTECHIKPVVYTDAGHLHPPPGRVTFGALAATTNAPAARSGPPTWDHDAQTCSNVYCHGAAFADTSATVRTPTWNGGPAQAACGTCHGLPPSGHVGFGDRCEQCHSLVVDAERNFVDPARHVNGVVDLAGGTGCASCHGQPPPTGAHLAHTSALHGLSAPIACGECHTVPATVDAPGHIDGVIQVPLAGSLARANGATPAWDPATMSCSNVYCHGAAQPVWTAGTAAATCGTCHGVPPADGVHPPTLKLTDCARCHSATMDASGSVKPGGAHLNGVVDVQM